VSNINIVLGLDLSVATDFLWREIAGEIKWHFITQKITTYLESTSHLDVVRREKKVEL
jgi:hypothetical protein